MRSRALSWLNAWGIAGGIIALVVVGVFSWWTVSSEGKRVTATTIGYDVVSDDTVKVTFDVTRPVDQAVTCTVSAMDSHFTVVGRSDVVVPVATTEGQRTSHHDAIVRTTTRAVTGLVQDCVRT